MRTLRRPPAHGEHVDRGGAAAQLRRAQRFDDEIVIESEVSEWGRSSFTVSHRILKDSELALEGFEKRVWAGRDANGAIKSQKVPAEIIASLSDPTGGTTVSMDNDRK